MELYAIIEFLQYLPLLLQIFEGFFGDTGLSEYMSYLSYLPLVSELLNYLPSYLPTLSETAGTINITQLETMDYVGEALNIINNTQQDTFDALAEANRILADANAKTAHKIDMNLIHTVVSTALTSLTLGLLTVMIIMKSLGKRG